MTDANLRVTLFEEARRLCNQDPEFRKLGTCDARVGIKAGDVAFIVAFEAFECVSVAEVAIDDLRDADFTIDLPRATWRELLERRRSGDGRASLISYSVDVPGFVVAASPLNALKFERYHRTLQLFFDRVAALAPPSAA